MSGRGGWRDDALGARAAVALIGPAIVSSLSLAVVVERSTGSGVAFQSAVFLCFYERMDGYVSALGTVPVVEQDDKELRTR